MIQNGGVEREERGTPTYHLFAVPIRKETTAQIVWGPVRSGFQTGLRTKQNPFTLSIKNECMSFQCICTGGKKEKKKKGETFQMLACSKAFLAVSSSRSLLH